MGNFCFGESKNEGIQQNIPVRNPIQKVDEVKFKLKKARDTIKNFINSKNKDLNQIELKIQQKVPAFKTTGNKKQLIPLLRAKKDILNIIETGDVRLKLVNTKLDEVEMQKINAETISVLDDSNKYIRQIQEQLQKKDWRNVLAQAQQKVQIEWPDNRQQEQNDPAFQKMWKQLGGDQIAKGTIAKKQVEVHVIENRREKEVLPNNVIRS